MAVALSLFSTTPVFAGQWRQDAKGWWWQSSKSDDPADYPTGEWRWIDGNQDGIAECYRFDKDGYILTNTSIDGSDIDGNGAWVIDGVVQQKDIRNQKPGINPVILEDMKLTLGELKAKYGECKISSGARTYMFPYGEGEYAHDGAGVAFENSPLSYWDSREFIGSRISYLGTNYVFYETTDQLNDNSKPLSIWTSQVFTGLPPECDLDQFKQFLNDLGAEQIVVLDKVINRDDGISYTVTNVRFVYDGLWFYVTGRYDKNGSRVLTTFKDGTYRYVEVFSQKNEYEEQFTTESHYTKPGHNRVLSN